jgi:hypothetical protein
MSNHYHLVLGTPEANLSRAAQSFQCLRKVGSVCIISSC